MKRARITLSSLELSTWHEQLKAAEVCLNISEDSAYDLPGSGAQTVQQKKRGKRSTQALVARKQRAKDKSQGTPSLTHLLCWAPSHIAIL